MKGNDLLASFYELLNGHHTISVSVHFLMVGRRERKRKET